MWWVWLISLTTGSNIPSYTVELIYSVYNVRVYPLFTHYINTSLEVYMYIISFLLIPHGLYIITCCVIIIIKLIFIIISTDCST